MTDSNGSPLMSNLSAEGQLQQYLKEFGTVKCVQWLTQRINHLRKLQTEEEKVKNRARAAEKRNKDRIVIQALRKQLEEVKTRLRDDPQRY